MTANEVSLSWEDFQTLLYELDKSCDEFDVSSLQKLILLAPTGYKPSSGLCDLVWKGCQH